jgi:hypothetical protein
MKIGMNASVISMDQLQERAHALRGGFARRGRKCPGDVKRLYHGGFYPFMSRSFPIGFAGARTELHISGHRRGVVVAGAGPQLEPRASQCAREIDDISHVRQSARRPPSQSRPLAPGSPAESLQRVSAQPVIFRLP